MCRRDRLRDHGRHGRHGRHGHDGPERGDGLGFGATDMVYAAAIPLLVLIPRRLGADCAIWNRASGRRTWRWRRRWWWRWGRSLKSSCWANCSSTRGGASDTSGRAAELLLCQTPRCLEGHRPSRAIVSRAGEQPEQKWQQQKQTQEAARRDEASKVPAWTHCIKIAATAYVFVGSFLLAESVLRRPHGRTPGVSRCTVGNRYRAATLDWRVEGQWSLLFPRWVL